MTALSLALLGRSAAVAAALAAGLVAAPAHAQTTAAAKPPGKGESQALRIFGMLDANGDGRISLQEAEVGFRLKPSLREDFKAADANHDGYLTQAEIRAVAERRRAERQARRQREADQSARSPGAAGAPALAGRALPADTGSTHPASTRAKPAVTIRTRGTTTDKAVDKPVPAPAVSPR